MEKILFSVITISYNSSPYIKQTIESVLAQSYQGFEYIICDDCSKDNSWKIIESYTDTRIRKFRNDTNIGEYANRTRAIQQATGRYVIFIDGDDYIYPNALDVFAYYVGMFPESAMFFSREWDHRILYPYKADPVNIYRFEFLDGGIIGGNFTKVLFKREVLAAYSFPANIRSGDTYIQLKIAQKFAGVAIPEGLTWWRRRKGNATENLFRDERHLAETINYRIALLNEDCPLPEAEIEQAKVIIYGLFLRELVRMIMRFKWSLVLFLVKRVHVPSKYYKCIFTPARLNYFNMVIGDEPLHTENTQIK
jgi:glycosyltransferase involved in cell wall biosynthesis